MLNVKKELEGDNMIVELIGVVDDSTDFNTLIGIIPASTLTVECGGVERINSVGVKKWIMYFTKIVQQKTELVFVNCSPPLVEQLNAFMNFACGGKVDSVQISFTCGSCGTTFVQKHSCQSLVEQKYIENVPNARCPKCGVPAEFDDLPSEYFAFLQRKKA